MTRDKLPARRRTIHVDFSLRGIAWTAGVGFDDAGTVREVFLSGPMLDSDACFAAEDACILASRLLQRGETPRILLATLWPDARRETGAPPATAIQEALRIAAELEES